VLNLVAPLLSCLLPNTLTPDTLDSYRVCQEQSLIIEHVIEWQPLVEKYFDDADVVKALTIIYCESSGRPSAINSNSNESKDIGLFQFNDFTWNWLKEKLKIKDTRYNPETNVAVASWLVYNDGWFHWNASKKCWGKYDG